MGKHLNYLNQPGLIAIAIKMRVCLIIGTARETFIICGIFLKGSEGLGSIHGSRKFCGRGPTLTFLFLEGREDPYKYHHKPAINETPAKRLAGVPIMAKN